MSSFGRLSPFSHPSPLNFPAVAHHAPDPEEAPLVRLPRSTRARLAAVTVGVLAVAAAVAGLWAGGGLESATATEHRTVEPGDEIRNSLIELRLHEAAFGRNPDTGQFTLDIRADIESRFNEPVSVSEIGGLFKPRFGRKDLAPGPMRMALTRHPEVTASDLQPGMPEEVVLSWPLSEDDPDDTTPKTGEEIFGEDLLAEPDDVSGQIAQVDEVEVTVTGAKYEAGFTDETKRWWTDNRPRAVVDLPVDEE